MVSAQSVNDQLKRLNVKTQGWGRTEIRELPEILMPGEEIYECVNGYYDAGFALLVATNVRVLLVDKKPLSYLTVEDLRFDMINEIDYSHRMIGAQINISAGSKNLQFRSYNKLRLRKLINHVQDCMAEAKKQHTEQQLGQNQHLQSINEQLQLYLLMQQGHERELTRRLLEAQDRVGAAVPVLPATDLQLAQQLALAANAEIFGETASASPELSTIAQPTVAADGTIQLDPLRTAYTHIPLTARHRYFGRAANLASGVGRPVKTAV